MTNPIKYVRPMTVKFPKDVWEAMQKRLKHKRIYYPRYCEADLIRTAVVKHLKEKGFLEKGKDYL